MKISIAAALIGLGLCGSQAVLADDDLWFGAKAGTLGLGLEATWRPLAYLDLRAGLNSYDYDTSDSYVGIGYDVQLDLSTYYITANLRVPLSPFRMTAGVFSNGNEVMLTSDPNAVYDVGGTIYTGAQVGTLMGGVDFDSTAPYFGFGADFRLADTFGLNIDLGVLWQGSPRVALAANGPIASDPTFQTDLEAERVALENDLDKFKAYPVASIGFSFNF